MPHSSSKPPLVTLSILGRSISAPSDQIIARLVKINDALVERLENRIDQQGSAYSLFQTAISLEAQVRHRTAELKTALNELERINAELVQAKEAAEKANLSKTRFLAAAGHDLLQPLYAAQLSISTLMDLSKGIVESNLTRQTDRALVTIEAYLRSILDISKLDAGVIVPDIKPVVLSDMFQSLDSDFRLAVEKKSLRLRFHPTSLVVASDPVLLRRILQNLVSNAIRYTQKGGVLVGARRRGGEVRIDVVDTGVGIEPHDRKAIFEEFHRLNPTEAGHNSDGLGLGLSIVERIAQALSHPIELSSNPGRGSRFSVRAFETEASRLEAAPVVDEPPARLGADLSGLRILLVENDVDVRLATSALLQQWGCEVVPVASLRETHQAIESNPKPFDLIVADFHLEANETGLEAIHLARRLSERAIPALIVTADQGTMAEELSRKADCLLLRKPVKPAQLRAVIAHLL